MGEQYQRLSGDERPAIGFAAVHRLLDEAKGELRDGSTVGAMEKVAQAGFVLNRALCDLETVTNVPWMAIATDPGFGRA